MRALFRCLLEAPIGGSRASLFCGFLKVPREAGASVWRQPSVSEPCRPRL